MPGIDMQLQKYIRRHQLLCSRKQIFSRGKPRNFHQICLSSFGTQLSDRTDQQRAGSRENINVRKYVNSDDSSC